MGIDLRLQGKVVVITGSSITTDGGRGRALA